MNLEAVKVAAESNIWSAILPELALGCLAVLLLVFEMLLPRKQHSHISTISILGQIAILVLVCVQFDLPPGKTDPFSGLLHQTATSQAMRVFFLLASIFVSMIARVSLARQRLPRIEFYHIVLVASAAMMLLAQANHFLLLFVALETLTIGLYILVSYFRTNSLTLEAGLKYLVMGALSSSLLLFGIVLLYGVAGNPALPGHASNSMHFGELANFLAQNPRNFLAGAGIVLVLSGIAFKIGAFPFQIWIPDVYQGAPTPVTAFLAVSSKAAGFAILLVLANTVFVSYGWLVHPVLTLMAAATLIFGNLAALTQHNVKRLIGLSGVSHAGFLLLGVVAVPRVPGATGAVIFYLFAYLIASFAVFGVMAHVAGDNDTDQELDHYAGLARQNPFLATVLAVALGSLAGIPPLAGFMGKLFIFVSAFKAGMYGLLMIAIVSVVISIYYYFGWIRAAFFETWTPSDGAVNPPPTRSKVSGLAHVGLAALALCSILFGFYQGPLGAWLLAR
ncbi:MAG: NADH-quinone oxidoreductase subunit N [Opitutus sp.]